MRILREWPRPNPDTGIGLHLSANPYDTRYRDPENVKRDVALWRDMGINWLKVFASGDSQVIVCREFVKQGFMVIVRLDGGTPRRLDPVPPQSDIRPYVDAGCAYAEGYVNEPEIELNLAPNADTISRLAIYYRQFADNCAHVGILPCTPAMQGDRLHNWFLPFVREMKKRNWLDAIEGSVISGHWRPGDYWRGDKTFPVNSPPIDTTHGGVGFVFRSYEEWDKEIRAIFGGPLPLLGTEAGREPSEVRGDLAMHARDNVQIATMPWLHSLFCQCYWIWNPPWSNSPWIDEAGNRKPVVDAFRQMQKRQRWPTAEEPGNVWTEAEAVTKIRQWCWDNREVKKGGWNAQAAFQKGLPDLGMPVTDETHQYGWAWQAFAMGIKYCLEGQWNRIRVMSWIGL